MQTTRTMVTAALALLLPLSLAANGSPIDVYVGSFDLPPATVSTSYEWDPNQNGIGPFPVAGPFTLGENGTLDAAKVSLPDLSRGGSVSFSAGSLGYTYSGVAYLPPQQTAPVDGSFSFHIGQAIQDPPWFGGGPDVVVSGTVHGTIYGPIGLSGALDGGFKGTATSATLNPFGPPGGAAALPPPLLDILNNPSHLHISGQVTGGVQNILSFTLTFDPPSPVTVPEPTTLAVLAVGAAWPGVRRGRQPRRPR